MKFFTDCKTKAEAKKHFKKMAMLLHPDKGGSDELMIKLKEQFDAYTGPEVEENSKTYGAGWQSQWTPPYSGFAAYTGANNRYGFGYTSSNDDSHYNEKLMLEKQIAKLKADLSKVNSEFYQKNNVLHQEIANLKASLIAKSKEYEDIFKEHDEMVTKVEHYEYLLRQKPTTLTFLQWLKMRFT